MAEVLVAEVLVTEVTTGRTCAAAVWSINKKKMSSFYAIS